MKMKTEQPHNNTYAKQPTAYSIQDALNYILKECYKLNDVRKTIILQKAIIDMEIDQPQSEYNQQEFER